MAIQDSSEIFMKRITKVIFYTIAIAVALIALFPFIWGFITSLKPTSEVNNFSINFSEITFESYWYILANYPFLRWFLNSFIVAILLTLGNLIINSMAGYALARIKFRGRNVIFLSTLALMMIPAPLTIVPMFVILAKLGWINTYQGIIVPFLFNLMMIFLMRQHFLKIPRSLEEAAEIDGLGRFGIFFRIILPVSKPILAAQFIIVYVGNWNSFLWPQLLLRTEDMYTLPIGLDSFYGQFVQFWNQVLAGTMLLSIPMIVIFLIFQKQFVQGIAGEGIKD